MIGWKKTLIATAVVAAFGAAVAGYLYHEPGMRYYFILYLGRAGHVVLFAAVTWVAYFVGRLVSRVVFRPRVDLWELELGLGLFACGVAAFALAATHLLYPWVVRVFVLVLLALWAPTFWRLARGAGGYFRARWAGLTPASQVVIAAALPFAATALARVGEPPFEWDVLVYHLYLPKLFTASHGFVYLPRLVYVSMPLGAEMVFTWAYAWDGLGVASAVAPLFHFLMVVATWRTARLYVNNAWAVLAAVLLLLTPTFAYLASIPYVDMVLGAYALMAFIVYARGMTGAREAALAGVFLGAAMSVKYTGINAVVAFAAVAAWDLGRRRLRLNAAVVFLGTAFVVVAPWLVKAFVERGNPVFPVLYGWLGGRDLTPEAAAGIVRAMRAVGMGRGWLDYLMLPYRLSVLGGEGYDRFAGMLLPFTFAALALAPFVFRRARLLIFTWGYFIAWAFIGSQQLRFLSAFCGAAAVIISGVAGAAAGNFRAGARTAASAVIAGTLVAFGYFVNFGYLASSWEKISVFASGDRDAFLTKWAGGYGGDKFINENVPRDATVLLLFDNCRLYLERRAVCDSFCDASETIHALQKMKSAAEVGAYVRSLGADYIGISNLAASYFWSYYDRGTRALWDSYAAEYTTVIYRDAQYEVRRINPEP